MKTFNELAETQGANDVHGQVMHNGVVIKIRYKYKGKPFWIDLPKTEINDYLKKGDEVDMQIYI